LEPFAREKPTISIKHDTSFPSLPDGRPGIPQLDLGQRGRKKGRFRAITFTFPEAFCRTQLFEKGWTGRTLILIFITILGLVLFFSMIPGVIGRFASSGIFVQTYEALPQWG